MRGEMSDRVALSLSLVCFGRRSVREAQSQCSGRQCQCLVRLSCDSVTKVVIELFYTFWLVRSANIEQTPN